MTKTKLWSMQFSCRRLAREARNLVRTIDRDGSATAKRIEQHLCDAAELLAASMQTLGAGAQPGAGVLDLAQLAFGDNAWTGSAPLADARRAAESPPSPDHKLGLQAQSSFVQTPDLMAFLCSLKKTGVLLIDTADERFTIELVDGEVAHAHSDGAPDQERLGNVLVEHGVLTSESLDRLLGSGTRTRLGSQVLDQQLATREELRAALETQIRRLFQRLFTSTAQEYVFWDGPCVWGDQIMRLNGTMLLLEGARAADESSRQDPGPGAAATRSAVSAAAAAAFDALEDAGAKSVAATSGLAAIAGSGAATADAGTAEGTTAPEPTADAAAADGAGADGAPTTTATEPAAAAEGDAAATAPTESGSDQPEAKATRPKPRRRRAAHPLAPGGSRPPDDDADDDADDDD